MRIAAFLVGLGLMLAPLSASASGGVWCEAKDDNLAFDFSAGQSRDGGGWWFGIQGNVVSKVDKLPADLAKFAIVSDNITQRWLDRDSVRLLIEKTGDERQNFASVRLTVSTVALEEAAYKGAYLLNIRLPDGSEVSRDGIVSCSAE
jgi:hypothetical protein